MVKSSEGSRVVTLARRGWHAAVRVEREGPGAYAPFARFHYLGCAPATIDRVLVARVDGLDAGVLVTSRPVLNAAWRRVCWPGVFDTSDKRRDALAVNTTLRTISRVVVDPRWRGLGVATALVRSYLADPATVMTEAVAAMGRVSPFFERAGMTRLEIPPGKAERQLARELEKLGIAPPRLFAPRLPGRAIAAVDRWALSGRRARRFEGRPLRERARAAAAALLAPPVAFWFTSGSSGSHSPERTRHAQQARGHAWQKDTLKTD